MLPTLLSEYKYKTHHLPHRHFPCYECCEKYFLIEEMPSMAGICPASPPLLTPLLSADSTLPILLIYFASKFVQKVVSEIFASAFSSQLREGERDRWRTLALWPCPGPQTGVLLAGRGMIDGAPSRVCRGGCLCLIPSS